MGHYTEKIDWKTASVEPLSDGLRLSVDLVSPTAPDPVWSAAFEEIAHARTRAIGSDVERVALNSSTLSVIRIWKGEEDGIRAGLEAIVEETNRTADQRRAETIAAGTEQKRVEDRLAADADEMTQRFRRDS
jgi:hypothetical protein